MITGKTAEAETTLTRAYFEAQDAGSTEAAFRSARSLVSALTGLERYHEAALWARHADVLAASLDDPGDLDAAEGHYLLVQIDIGLRDYAAAIAEGEKAVELRAAFLGADHPLTAAAQRELGVAYLEAGRAGDALALFERVERIWEDAVGRVHPQIGGLAFYRAQALRELGRVDEALAAAREGLAIHEQVLPAGHHMLTSNTELVAELDALQRRDTGGEAGGEPE